MEQTDKKISQMPPLQTVSGDEIVPVVKSGGNYSALVSQIVALARQTMVEAQAGKGLSANDFTDALKAKLEGLSNYDDTQVRALITAINGRLDTILGDGASTAIDTFNEIEAFLAGITDTQTLTGLLQEQKQTITNETDDKLAGKVDKVSGKGLSANDYTNEDKAKLTRLLPNGQFGYTGHYGMDGKFYTAPNYANSGLIPVNRNFDIEFAANVGGSVASVVFYAADKRFIKAVQIPQTLAQQVLPAADIPVDAVFFIISTASPAQSYYRNGLTIESREGAMAEALASLGRGLVDQFIIKGYFLGKRGNVNVTSSENTGVTPLLPLSKTYPIVLKNVLAYGNAVAVGFYDAVGTFISYPEGIENLNGDFTVTVDKYPAGACYFRACSEKAGSAYTNGPSIESREGAVSEAIQAAITAAVDEALIAESTAAGAVFNRTSGYFELNGLTDITAKQMRTILAAGARQSSTLPWAYVSSTIRTHLPRVGIAQADNAVSTFRSCSFLETVEMPNMILQGDVFFNCNQLRSVNWKGVPIYNLNGTANANFQGCSKLVELRGCFRSNFDFNIADSPLLSLASIQYMVDYAYNTAPITVTVHPTVYGKLTDEQADIMALLPENLLEDVLKHSVGVTVIDGGIEITAAGQYVRFNHSPHLVDKGLGKLTIACDVEGLGDGELIKLAVGGANNVQRPKWIISANGRAVFSFDTSAYYNDSTSSNSFLLYDDLGSFNGQSVKLTNFKLSYGEYDALPYTAPLSTITDDATREKAEWLSLMQIAEARQINFVTTE